MTTRSELLEVVHRFYPPGVLPIARMHVPPGEPVYDDTEEHRRLVEAASRGRAEYPTWEAMFRRLEDRYSAQNESLSLFSGGTDPAYSARIWLTRDIALSFHVSLLGPYYGIHLPGIPDEEPVAREIAREIEATYPGYQPIPPELGNEVVPDVATHCAWMGEATIYLCLFSEVWTWVDPVADPGTAQTPAAQLSAHRAHPGDRDPMNESSDRREITREIKWLPKGATEPRTFCVRVGLPEPHPELGGFGCTLMIEGDGWNAIFGGATHVRPGTVHDSDAMLALTATLAMVPEVIEYYVKLAGGRVLSRLRPLDDREEDDPAAEAEQEPDENPAPPH